MKKILSVVLCLLFIISLTACADVKPEKENSEGGASVSSNAENRDNNSDNPNNAVGKDRTETDSDILIAYFSCTGNTAQMADYISAETGGALFAITPAKPYMEEDLDYRNDKCRAEQEHLDADARPEISAKIENFNRYKTIYLGYPVWYDDAPKIIYTFLESYDFSGKTIIPFCTSAQTDIKNSEANIKKLTPKAKWKKGKRFSPSAFQKDISDWIS